MPDLSWPGWGIIVSILAAIIPVLFRLRAALTKVRNLITEARDLITEVLGIIALMGGLFFYTVTVPQWHQVQALFTQLSAPANPGVGQQLQTLQTLYFGSIGLMILGGLLTVFGLLGRIMNKSR